MSRESIALAIVFLVGPNASQAQGANLNTRLHFKVIAGSMIVVPVMVNGRGPYDFVLDTGTESTLIDTDLAQQIGVPVIDRIRLEGANGSAALARAFADEISLGPARVRNSEVLIGALAPLHSINRRIRGIIGQSFLRHFDYILDNAHSAIEMVEGSETPPIDGKRVNFMRSRGRPLLPVKLDQSQMNFVLDSGASNVVVYSQLRSVGLPCLAHLCTCQMQSSFAATEVPMARLDTLEVAGHRFGNLQAAVMKGVSRQEADGLLPTRFFSKVYFSNSGGYVVLAGPR